MYKLKTAFTAVAICGVVAGAGHAIDAEFAGMNPYQAKMRASHYKAAHAAMGAGLLGHVAYGPTKTALEDADAPGLRTLIEAHHTGDIAPFVTAFRTAAKAAVGSWIDLLLPGGDAAFIEAAVTHDGSNVIAAAGGIAAAAAPATENRDAFKTALNAVIDRYTVAQLNTANARIAPPADFKLHTLGQIDEALKDQLNIQIGNWIDALLVPNNAFILGPVHIHGGHGAPAGAPADRTRDGFKAALQAVIGGVNI